MTRLKISKGSIRFRIRLVERNLNIYKFFLQGQEKQQFFYDMNAKMEDNKAKGKKRKNEHEVSYQYKFLKKIRKHKAVNRLIDFKIKTIKNKYRYRYFPSTT